MFSNTPKVRTALGSLQHVRSLPDLRTKILALSPVWFLLLAKSFSDKKKEFASQLMK